MNKKTQKKPAEKAVRTAVKKKTVRQSPLDELAAKAPPRGKLTAAMKAEVLKLLGKYKRVDEQLDSVDSRQSSLLSEREKLAHQIVSRWGKGLLVYKGVQYMPASNHGKIVLRRLPDVEEIL